MYYYKIKENILWRNELNSVMLLHPISKTLMVFGKNMSDNTSVNGIIRKTDENEKSIFIFKNEGLVYKYNEGIGGTTFGSAPTLSAPLNVTMQITDRCNLKCIHCHRKDKGILDLNFEKLKELIDEFYEMRVFNINISGGEAMMHKDIFSIIEYGIQKGLKVTMSTNAVLLNQKSIRTLYDLGLRQLHISLDSHIEKNHDAIRGVKSAYLKMIHNIALLREYGIKFTFVTTLVDQSVEEYAQTIDFSYSMGASGHKTNLVVPQGQGIDLAIPYYNSPMLLEKYIQVFKEKRGNYGDQMHIIGETMFLISSGDIIPKENVPDVLKLGCPAGYTTSAITELGEVLACPFFSELEVGNINKKKFKEIWNSSVILNKIRNRSKIEGCSTCSYKQNCGGCRARVYGINKSPLLEDAYCFKNIEHRVKVWKNSQS